MKNDELLRIIDVIEKVHTERNTLGAKYTPDRTSLWTIESYIPQIVAAARAGLGRDRAAAFLESTVYGHETGRVVCSVDLTEHQIAEAQATGRWFVLDCGLGFAMLPWYLTTDKDRAREHGWDSIDKARPLIYTEKERTK